MKQADKFATLPIEQATSIALVVETQQGEALKLTDQQNRDIPLRGHLSDVPWLEVGDEVVIVDSDEGAIVSGRIRRVGELPAATLSVDDKTMALVGDRPLYIQVGESRLELMPDGRVRIEGKQVTQVAAGSMTLLSPVIEIN
ncbi:MAG: hypothetical protein KZQ93_05185 [Candidatus Thiodiazotropha sp. (ex Monitilora ramsayi)]|nr:hypothetical protein [Candidatus Thiodiazotropha sp. (ex Monitilora ramsayi)]